MSDKYSMLIEGDVVNVLLSTNDGKTWSTWCTCRDAVVAKSVIDALSGDGIDAHAECYYELLAVKQDMDILKEIALEAGHVLKSYLSMGIEVDRAKAGRFLNRLEEFLKY